MKTNFTRLLYILLPLLLAACGPLAPMPTVTPSATTIVPSSTPTLALTEMPTPAPQQPPTCIFPLEQTTMEKSKPEEYTFSEPRVVLADSKGNFEIVEWLPNSQRALIVRTIIENHYEQYQSIELFDPRKIKVQVYAKSKAFSMPPLWVEGLNAVIYQERKVVSFSRDENGAIIQSSTVFNDLLWLNNGNPETAEKLEGVQFNPSDKPHGWRLIARPDGGQIIYLEIVGKNSYQFYSQMVSQGSLESKQLIPFNGIQFPNSEYSTNYAIAIGGWRPTTTQILLNSSEYAPGGSYSFLFDINTGKICSLDFGNTAWGERQWAITARWSPNGRYLAIIRTTGSIPIGFSNLAVLDTMTGNLYTLAFSPQNVEGRRYVWDVAWAPDNYHLAAIGRVSAFPHCAPNCMEEVGRLYLVDFVSGNADLLFPSFQFTGGGLGDSLAWSPDGTKILANCWAENASRLCLISVQHTTPP